MVAKPTSKIIQSATKSGKEAASLFKSDAERRLKDQEKILTATDLSGEYNTLVGNLFTTFGGKPRLITSADLEHFRSRVRDIKKRSAARGKFKGGMTIGKVLDVAAPIDKQRAGLQIKQAIPLSNKGSVIHFVTNSGFGSKVARHHAYVELLNFAEISAEPIDSMKAAIALIKKSPIKYDCDCERHTFWYRYICSIGGFAYGRLEDGYPKIKNPQLYGCACKHIVKVMQVLSQSPSVRQYIQKMIERNRKELVGNKLSQSPKQQEEFLKAIKEESKNRVKQKPIPKSVINARELKAIARMESKAEKARNEKAFIDSELNTLKANLANLKLDEKSIAFALKNREKDLKKAYKEKSKNAQ